MNKVNSSKKSLIQISSKQIYNIFYICVVCRPLHKNIIYSEHATSVHEFLRRKKHNNITEASKMQNLKTTGAQNLNTIHSLNYIN